MATTHFHGDPVSTVGELPAPGTEAPAFVLTGADLSDVTSQSLTGKRVVLNVFPSIDTGVCAASVREFNKRAADLDGIVVVCASSFRSSFGEDYGVPLTDGPLAGLLARAVVVLDADGRVLHTQLVDDIADEPDYAAALAALDA